MSNHIGGWEPEGLWFEVQLQIKKLESWLVKGEVVEYVQSTAKAQKSKKLVRPSILVKAVNTFLMCQQVAMAVLEVLCSLIGWFALYQLFCSACAQRGSEWNCRLVTLSHGVLIVLLTGYVAFVDGPWPFTHAGQKPLKVAFCVIEKSKDFSSSLHPSSCIRHAGTDNTDLQIFSLEVCLGYFFFDLGWCVYNRSEGPIMVAHHTASIAGLLLALVMGVSGCETCAVIFGSELTNPLLQIRWFLRQLGLYDSLLGDVIDLLFIFLFATVRIGVGTAMFYCELTSPRTTAVMKLGGVVMYTIAWVFMVDIARFGYKKSRSKYKRWKETQKLRETTEQEQHSHKTD